MLESVAILCNALSHESDLAEGAAAPVHSLPGQAGQARKGVMGQTLRGQCTGIEAGQLGQNRSAGGFEDQLTEANRVTGDVCSVCLTGAVRRVWAIYSRTEGDC